MAPTFEVDQETDHIKYVPSANVPTDLIYGVRLSTLPDSRLSFDVGAGHVGAQLASGINIKVNNAVAFAVGYRY